jgi:fluoroacetyl-CoA thioesterase
MTDHRTHIEGHRAHLEYVVTDADTALAVGSGSLPVLGTPRLIAWMEAATVAVADALARERSAVGVAAQTSVGTRVDIEHLAASPVGARVEVTADLTHRDGRLLRFAVAAHHDSGEGPVLIGRGEITRVVVQTDRFLARLPKL